MEGLLKGFYLLYRIVIYYYLEHQLNQHFERNYFIYHYYVLL